jgi:hypothetical protein
MKEPDARKSKSTQQIENCLDYYEIRIKRSLRDPKFVLEVLGFVVLLIYAGYTIGMYYANRESADAARTSADAATGQLIQMTTQAEDDQRAWIGVTDIRITQLNPTNPALPFITQISVSNSGKTPAINLKRASAYMISSSAASGPKPEYVKTIEDKIRGIRDHIAVPPNGINTLEASDGGDYVIPKWSAICGKTEMLYVYGRLEYEDIAKRGHATTFCYYLKEPTSEPPQFASCEAYNDMN